MSVVALIPLRGGSKSIPQKNIRSIAGKPLAAWVLDAATNSSNIDKIFVSTDSNAIAEGVHNGKGDVDFFKLRELLNKYAPNVQFIPEVWQGHKNSGEGFWSGLEFLEKIGF